MSIDFNILVGKTLTEITIDKNQYAERIEFETNDGKSYVMMHYQDCCESVMVEEIIGDIFDLVNDGPVLLAEEAVKFEESDDNGGYNPTIEWTFYKLRTKNADVTIRWMGESEYYGTEVSFFESDKGRYG